MREIISRLRAPEGCPWDREQTHASLKRYLLEETYEVLEALDNDDSRKLCEELGDLLLQIMLHAQIASETDAFDIDDVIRSIANKLIRRHPHVFGKSTAGTAAEVAGEWEEIKREEREPGESLLNGVPRGMPALSYSDSIQRRAAGIGFDWHDTGGVLQKLVEEVGELEQAETMQQKAGEFGDILFSLVNYARWHGLDPEEALRLANTRFYRRFRHMEESCRKKGITLRDLSFEEQNRLWDEAKKHTQQQEL